MHSSTVLNPLNTVRFYRTAELKVGAVDLRGDGSDSIYNRIVLCHPNAYTTFTVLYDNK